MALLTISEAARVIGVSVDTLRKWADDGRVPYTRLPSGHRRWAPDQLRSVHEMLRQPVAADAKAG